MHLISIYFTITKESFIQSVPTERTVNGEFDPDDMKLLLTHIRRFSKIMGQVDVAVVRGI